MNKRFTSIFQLLLLYKNQNFAFLDQAMVSGANFLTSIFFARFLGVKEFGKFTLIWMTVLFINGIQNALIISPMMSIGPKQLPQDKCNYYRGVISQQIFFACFTSLLVWGGVKYSIFFYPEWGIESFALPLSCVVFFFQTQDFLRRFFFTIGKPVSAFSNDFISYIGQLALLLFVFYSYGLNTLKVLWVIAVTSALAVFIGTLSIKTYIRPYLNTLKIFKRHWTSSKWLLASIILQWFSGNLFFVFTGALLGTGAVGALKAAQNILSLSNIFLSALDNFVPVRASIYLFEEGSVAMYLYLKKILLLCSIPIALIAFVSICWPVFWLQLFYGNQFVEYGYLVQLYAVISFFFLLALPLRTALRSFEYVAPIFIADVAKVAFTFLFAKSLINMFGLTGVAAGILSTHVISFCIISTILFFYTKKTASHYSK